MRRGWGGGVWFPHLLGLRERDEPQVMETENAEVHGPGQACGGCRSLRGVPWPPHEGVSPEPSPAVWS